MATGGKYTYHGEHFVMYVKRLYCTPETNILLYVSNTSKKDVL